MPQKAGSRIKSGMTKEGQCLPPIPKPPSTPCVRNRYDRLREGRLNYKAPWQCLRSEEHTSELQSLMRISYAVFCLKKKKKKNKTNKNNYQNEKKKVNMIQRRQSNINIT